MSNMLYDIIQYYVNIQNIALFTIYIIPMSAGFNNEWFNRITFFVNNLNLINYDVLL